MKKRIAVFVCLLCFLALMMGTATKAQEIFIAEKCDKIVSKDTKNYTVRVLEEERKDGKIIAIQMPEEGRLFSFHYVAGPASPLLIYKTPDCSDTPEETYGDGIVLKKGTYYARVLPTRNGDGEYIDTKLHLYYYPHQKDSNLVLNKWLIGANGYDEVKKEKIPSYYKIDVKQNGYLEIDFKLGNVHTVGVNIYSKNKKFLTGSAPIKSDSDKGTQKSMISVSKGTYYLLLDGEYYQYKATFHKVKRPTNLTRKKAQKITLNKPTYLFYYANDKKTWKPRWYKVTLKKTQRIHEFISPFVTFYDAKGNLVKWNTQKRQSAKKLKPGTYYIQTSNEYFSTADARKGSCYFTEIKYY